MPHSEFLADEQASVAQRRLQRAAPLAGVAVEKMTDSLGIDLDDEANRPARARNARIALANVRMALVQANGAVEMLQMAERNLARIAAMGGTPDGPVAPVDSVIDRVRDAFHADEYSRGYVQLHEENDDRH